MTHQLHIDLGSTGQFEDSVKVELSSSLFTHPCASLLWMLQRMQLVFRLPQVSPDEKRGLWAAVVPPWCCLHPPSWLSGS